MSAISSLFGALFKNTRSTLGVLVALLVVALIAGLLLSRRQSQMESANAALFQAQKTLTEELTALAPPPAPAEAGNPQQAPAAEDLSFRKLDVDAKLAGSVKKLADVSKSYSGTRAGFEAEMTLGSLYLQHGEAAKSLPWFEKAANSAPNRLEKALSLSAQGYALENLSKSNEALQAFDKALNQGEASLKGELLLAKARTFEALKDTAKARSTYEQIVSQLPNTEFSRTAEARKTALPQ